MKFYFIILISVSILFLGCSTKNVYFFNPEKVEDKYADNTIQLHIDAFGNLYPEEFVNNDTYTLNLGTKGGLCDILYDDISICTQTSNDDISELCEIIKKHPSQSECTLNCLWMENQTRLWSKKAEEIYLKAKKEDKELFFLIHGFNNTSKQASEVFQLVKGKVLNTLKNKKTPPLFVEIYWDGFSTGILKSWFTAQSSGPLVGFNLRQLFKEISNKYPDNKELPDLYFLTHSSGAFIVGALFGNPEIALPDLSKEKYLDSGYEYINFRNNRDGNNSKYPIPSFPTTRIGMIAAATPTNTFLGDISSSKKSGILSKNTELILSINKNDLVLGKAFLFPTNFFGATGVGRDRELYEDLCTLNNRKESSVSTYAYDFDIPYNLYEPIKSHSMENYLKHTNATSFFNKLLNIGDDEKGLIVCPPK